MRTWLTNFAHLGRRLGQPAGLAVLLALGGCSLSENEDEGDPEPDLGEYLVSVSPNFVILTTNSPSATVNLSITCIATSHPSDCESNLAQFLNWQFNNLNKGVSVSVANPNAPSTTATLTLTDSGFSKSSGSSSSLGGLRLLSSLTEFYPWSLNLWSAFAKLSVETRGESFVEVQVVVPAPYGERQEKSATQPWLVALPNPMQISPSSTNGSTAVVTYQGPVTSLMSVKFGLPNDPQDFSLEYPSLPLVMTNNFIFPLTVIFTGQATWAYHTNQIELSTLNGATTTIAIRAWR